MEDEVARFRSLDKQHFIDTITIKDDAFETYVVISTLNGFIQNWPRRHRLQPDSFLRGYIDKKTGIKSFKVYVHLKHYTGNWLYPYQANYGRPLRTSETIRVSSDVDCGGYSCRYDEHAVFTVDEAELRRMETLTPEDIATKTWVFKLKNQGGEDIMDGFNVNEILGFLEVMDNYKPIATLK